MKRFSFARGSSTNSIKATPISEPEKQETAEIQRPADDKIEEMYSQVLDQQLIPHQVKEQLIATQSLDKKWQTIKMHTQNQAGSKTFSTFNWGDKEKMLLLNIQKAKTPDIHDLSMLKVSLSTANKDFMNSFLDSGGVTILLNIIETRVIKKPITELDIAILYEIVSCLKSIMNNSTGMDGFLTVEGSMNTLAKCLMFEYKPFALLVLEILTVCCFYSEKAASLVVAGMRLQAKIRQEAPFACLSRALIEQDIELKSAVMLFVNNMIMNVADVTTRSLLRNDLNCQLFGERYDEANKVLETELHIINELSESNTSKSTSQNKLKRKSMISLYGPKAFNEKKVDAMLRNTQLTKLNVISEEGEGDDENGAPLESPNKIEIRSNNQVMWVNPLEGTMAGLLTAAKNAEKLESTIVDMLGGKKTKHRWYEIDQTSFKWCAGHDKENEYKGHVNVTSIIDIRPYTTDVSILESTRFGFEFETAERVHAFGCETEVIRDNWVTALQTCRDNLLMQKASYKIVSKEMTNVDVMKFAENFRKQGAVYHSICASDLKLTLDSNGLDMSNIHTVSRYLISECIASGTNAKLLAIMQELLIIPSGSDGTWDAVYNGIVKLRESSSRTIKSSDTAFQIKQSNVFDAQNEKITAGGSTYAQMSKLALASLNAEQESERLKLKIRQLEDQVSKLTEERAHLSVMSNNGGMSRPVSTESTYGFPNINKNNPSENNAAPTPTKQESTQSTATTVTPPPVPTATAPPVDDRFAKFTKMKSMLPEGAVRQKMALEGISQGDIDAFFNGTLPTSTAAQTPPAAAPAVVDEKFAKFVKMKTMLPEGAVRQKMAMEGISQSDIEAFFNGTLGTTTTSAPPAAPAAPAVVDEKFAKYAKMKTMLPEGAVRQKMTTDGISPAEIEAFFNGTLGTAPSVAAPAAPAVVDERYAKYAKMKTMLPEGAVRQKMTQDGFTPAEIDNFFNPGSTSPNTGGGSSSGSGLKPPGPPPKPTAPPAPQVELPPEGMTAKPKIVPHTKLKGLFWTKIKNAEIKDTIWYKLNEAKLATSESQQLEEWFAAKVTDATISDKSMKKGNESSKPETKLLSVLDGKRTQNVLIIMGKLRMTDEDILHMIVNLDPKVLTHELTTTLIDILPSSEEIAAIKAYTSPIILDNASKLIFQFNRIPRLPQRLECHEIAFSWVNNANAAETQLGIIKRACKELSDAHKPMEVIFSYILAIGNYINGDTARGQAFGVKMDTLLKLTNLKAALPSQGSLMNYLATIVESHHAGHNEIIKFSESWMGIWAAAEISQKQLVTDINQLEVQVNKVQNEFNNIKETKTNIGLDGVQEDNKGRCTHPLFKRLDFFLRDAKPKLTSIKEQSKTIETNVDGLMKKYGENLKGMSEEDPCKKFFGTISTFARSFEKAIDDNRIAREANEKAAKAAAEAEEKANEVNKKNNNVPIGGVPLGVPAKKNLGENIFGKFHSSQQASANDVVAEFQMKLQQRMKNKQ